MDSSLAHARTQDQPSKTELKNALDHGYAIVESFVKKAPVPERDELREEWQAEVGLVVAECLKTHDRSISKLSTHTKIPIQNRLAQYWEKRNASKNDAGWVTVPPTSKDEKVSARSALSINDDGLAKPTTDCPGSPENPGCLGFRTVFLEESLNKLRNDSPKKGLVAEMVFEGFLNNEIAAFLSLTETRVSQIKRELVEQIH
jgi:hypothetical protein